MAIVTKESLQELIDRNDHTTMHVVGRALVVLFNNQLQDEKESNDTTHHNGIGFTGADARSGSLTAKYYLKHKFLEEWQVHRWTKKNDKGWSRLTKYHRQLNVAAEAKAAKKDSAA